MERDGTGRYGIRTKPDSIIEKGILFLFEFCDSNDFDFFVFLSFNNML